MNWQTTAIVTGAIIVAVACRPDTGEPPGPTVAVSCPNHEVLIEDGDFRLTSDSIITTVGAKAVVPEWHDCQRFIAFGGGPPEYRQLVAIFASDSVEFPLSPDTAITIAVVYDYGEPYPPLKIGEKWNCLYAASHDSEVAAAWMLDVGNHTDCQTPIPVSEMPDTSRLNVMANSWAEFGPEDYPRAARWDVDPSSRDYYIGITCAGSAWCAIYGESTLTPSVSYPMPSGLPAADRRRAMIKGWYDEQQLAVAAPGIGGIVPARTYGTVFPAPGLEQWAASDFTGNWIRVGSVYLEAPLSDYTAKLGLEVTGRVPPDRPGNVIEICDDSTDECEIPTDLSACKGTWRARITPPGGEPVFRCVVRRDHEGLGHNPPGAARWHWYETDELLWFRCGVGCCEVDD